MVLQRIVKTGSEYNEKAFAGKKRIVSWHRGYVSINSRNGVLGTATIDSISPLLQQELLGLRDFAPSSIKRMRTFFEALLGTPNRPFAMGE
ncbi:MAG: hypothetical protein MJ202_02625, partial [Lentisphaeria bacterium]|nr:hypothetical protein [Lentisphaeria bacterium]